MLPVDCDNMSAMAADDIFSRRTGVFDNIVEFFPENMTQPRCNITDLIKLHADPVWPH